jgi:hypothetical protein
VIDDIDALCVKAPVIGKIDIAPQVVNPILGSQIKGMRVPVENAMRRKALVEAFTLNSRAQAQNGTSGAARRCGGAVALACETVLNNRTALALRATGVAIRLRTSTPRSWGRESDPHLPGIGREDYGG